jgi:hypothetical protein
MGSTEKLVAALKEAGAPSGMIRDAENNQFHDFKSDSATPIADLIQLARAYSLNDIAQRTIDGEFDATPEEAEEWAASEDGQKAFAMFGSDVES